MNTTIGQMKRVDIKKKKKINKRKEFEKRITTKNKRISSSTFVVEWDLAEVIWNAVVGSYSAKPTRI